jgi:hypothetical protein
MADEKQPTREEIRKQREDRIKSLEYNLTNDKYLEVLGVNDLKANQNNQYGDLGKAIGEKLYGSVMTSPDVDKIRKELYEKKLDKRKKMGIADAPEYTSNYEAIEYVLQIVTASMDLPLSKLEEILKKTDKRTEIEIPDELKKYEEAKNRQIEEGLESGKSAEEIGKSLNPDEESDKKIEEYKGLIYGLLKHAAAVKIRDQHEYDGPKAQAKDLAKKFREAKGIPEPEKEEPKIMNFPQQNKPQMKKAA